MNILIEKNNCLVRRFEFGELVSKSAAMEQIYKLLPLVAKSPSNVMILGEAGTGKEVIANAIHSLSYRKNEPFVAVNCGTVPENILDCKLFGCKAGAHPEIKEDLQGAFANADKGSLFLDEISSLTSDAQAKLVRVIQAKDYEALGAKNLLRANVRIMVGSSENLESIARNDLFRLDLFYRLNVIVIKLPPLRERMADVPVLAGHFIRKYNASRNKAVNGVSGQALDMLMQHRFPGNIRELEEIIEHAFIFCDKGYIQPEHLPRLYEADADPGQEANNVERRDWLQRTRRRELGLAKEALRIKIQRHRLSNPFNQPQPNGA